MTKKIFAILILGLMLNTFYCNLTLAVATAIQTVTVPVAVITEFVIIGNPGTLIINSAVTGSQPTSIIDSSSSYSISTNESNKKITGVLNSPMPANTSLMVKLAAPAGAISMGNVILSTSPADLVTGITKVAESGKTITYTFSSTVAAGIIASGTRTVTFTVTN